jgi:predicted TIM-barrel fold metal-dependent hydrolase
MPLEFDPVCQLAPNGHNSLTPFTKNRRSGLMTDKFPHASDNAQRDKLDNGFSAGWGRHFLPAEEHVIDAHMHIGGKEPWMIRQGLDLLFAELNANRLDQVIVVDGGPGSLDWFSEVAATDRRFNFMIWMRPENPDLDFLHRARQAGAVGLKLHNWRIMKGELAADIWETPQWQKIFAATQELNMPVLWHVTQVEGSAHYAGEGSGNAMVKSPAKGRKLCNAELLERFLSIVKAFPGITFVGAHMLYLGDKKLAGLFDAHKNLTVDTSCSYFLRLGDRIHQDDFDAARDFLFAYSKKIIFATDNRTGTAHSNPVCFEAFRCHLRYLKELRLPQEVLDTICWQNAQRIFSLSNPEGYMTATTRP